MLSILIPIYNMDVRRLVSDLHQQCAKCKIRFQIICFDDYSETKYKEKNRELDALVCVSYIELSENRGRSSIRNLLAKNSQYDNLLFLDSDSKVISKKFIKKYLPYLNEKDVINGGRVYNKKPSKSTEKVLHWKYGTARESMLAKKRNKDPHIYFHSNNFVIPRSVFLKNPFDITIDGYGYEDLVFAEALRSQNINILHIDNPVHHAQLKTKSTFIKEIDQSVINLANLHHQQKLNDTRLLRFYHKLKSWNGIRLFRYFYQKNEQRILENLNSDSPNLYFLDLYKLNSFCRSINEVEKPKVEEQ